jgi:ornithine cyclodeaminase/alanine dehydrogenase-like protein (mu-crystallin family)
VLVLDGETGQPRAVMDGQELTSIRSGAAGGLAAKLLAREDAKTVAVFGAGHQARAQLAGVRAVRAIERVLIVGRSRESAERLAVELGDELRVEVITDPAVAVRAADIVITATSSSEPVFDGRDLQPGVHITAVGAYKPTMRELDSEAVTRARVIVDHRAAALAEAGDLICADVTEFVELGEVVAGTKLGRQKREEITLFKSVGVAVQDAAAAQAVCDAAEKSGSGTLVEL